MQRCQARSFVRTLLRDDAGATSIEYALIGTLVSTFIIVALTAFADSENALFQHITTTVTAALGS
ncbi:MAG: Flp family type IVb pilin [Oligoflexia bacterium]|nr:Flp family type IVb pilin [Oligoflexia bacterium]